MDRRAFLATTAAVATLPCVVWAQAQRPLVVFFGQGSENLELLNAFLQGLKELGHTEGTQFTLEKRWGNDDLAKLPAIAQEIVRLNPAVVVATANAAPDAVRKATTTIPVVGLGFGEAAALGIVGNLDRPTANVTGQFSTRAGAIKDSFALIKEILPGAQRIGWIDWTQQPTDRAARQRDLDSVVAQLRVQAVRGEAATAAEFPAAFQALSRERAEAVLCPSGTLYTSERLRLIELAGQARIPAFFENIQAVQVGALAGRAVDTAKLYKAGATYVDKILKSAKPADLPVAQNPKYDLALNLKTAATLGITIPTAVRARADIVIQ